MSAVYSLAVQQQALWLLSGLESGGINLQSVRHDEGKRIQTLRGHTSAVSVLNLSTDEKSFLSGSWDKNVLDWDLHTGKVIRNFGGSTGQISALETRPESAVPVPETLEENTTATQGFSSNNADKPNLNGTAQPFDGKDDLFGDQNAGDGMNDALGSPADSLFGGDADSLFGDSDNIGPSGTAFVDEDNDFSKAIAKGLPGENHDQPPEIKDRDVEGDITMADTTKASDEAMNNTNPAVEDQDQSNSLEKALPEETSLNLSPRTEDAAIPIKQNSTPEQQEPLAKPGSVFLAASFDGSLCIWDKRQPSVVAKMAPHNVPPWCMNACWSPDGNTIYAGRRNGTVDEYNIHKGLQKPSRNFKLPNGSGAVSAVRAMPNGRHLIW